MSDTLTVIVPCPECREGQNSLRLMTTAPGCRIPPHTGAREMVLGDELSMVCGHPLEKGNGICGMSRKAHNNIGWTEDRHLGDTGHLPVPGWFIRKDSPADG